MTRKSRSFWSRLAQAMTAQAVKTNASQRLQPASAVRPLALEQRFMFDGAAAVDVAHVATDPAAPAAAEHTVDTATALRHALTAEAQRATEASPATTQRQEVVFVDSNIKDYQQLVSGLKPDTEVVVLDANKDGLQQIADYLDGRSGIDSIHVLSHGKIGQVQLGSDWLDSADLASRSELLNAIGQSIASDGDILLYGCQVGANGEGRAFIDGLAAATGADVAASSDLTGAASMGGDWVLEVNQGTIESRVVDGVASYSGLLVAADENYDDDASQTFNTSVFTLDGVKYTITGTGGANYSSLVSNDALASPLGNSGSDYFLLLDSAGLYGVTSIKVEMADGSMFRLNGLSFDGLADTNILITPNGGSALSFISNNLFITHENINTSGNTDFQNISSFTISGGNIGIALDDLNFEAPQVIPTLTSVTVADTSLKAGETSLVTFTFNTAVSGFTTADLTVDHGVITGLSTSNGGLTWTGTLTPDADVTDTSNLVTVNLAGVTSVSSSAAGSGTASSNNYAIDTHLPVVSAVSSSTANGTYKPGDTIAITVTFDETVTVTGIPQLTLETGNTDRVVNYTSGSGSSSLTFNYTVQAGDTSADLDYLGSGALSLNGGSIRDSAGNDATLTLASPGAAGSLGANKNIVINDAPSLGNLNGDSVAWAGVGNSVNLDVGGNATLADTEFGALNGGNGNWSGASLTVQRAGTAISTDVLGFALAGASFTVSGSNLQAGGLTFATFTNAGGVLTITFTSSGTTATTALVQNVLSRVTYRSDTPAGDATLRYSLSDGTSTATANLTVTSDTIYVTNTADTATIDFSNGVSLSEAVAIAAADATGSQTLILGSAFAGQTLSLAGNLSIGESLTLNGDSASGLTLSGSTITLGGGTTLNFSNSSGIVTVTSTLAGSGALAKAGGGTLALTSTSNEANMSGAITVTAGTLQVSNDDHLSSGTLTLNGGTLTNNSTAFTIDNAIVLGAAGGTINIGGGGGTTQVGLTGVISGSGSLTKNGQGILQLDGSNTYTGATNVSAGTLIANHANALGTLVGATTVSSGATVRIAGGLTIGEAFTVSGTGKQVGVNSFGALHLNSGSSTLSGNITLAGDADISAASGATLTLSGALGGGGFNLNKTDAGTLALANTGNEAGLTGGTTISAGTLSIGSDDQLAAGTLTLNGGTLALTGATTVDNAINLAATSTVSASANATLSGNIIGTGDLTKSGASTLTLSGTNNFAGAVSVTAGTLALQNGSALADSATVALSSGTTLSVSNSETIGGLSGAGNVNLSSNTLTVSQNANTTYSGVISGTGGLTKSGSGTLTLSGSNAYTGATTVSAGGLTLNGASGTLDDSTSVTVSLGATLTLGADDVVGLLSGAGTVAIGANEFVVGVGGGSSTFSGRITGSGTLTLDGSGTLTLSGINSGQSWGMQVLSGGTLSIAGDANLGSGTVQLNDGTLAITSSTSVDNAIALGASGGAVSLGSGLAATLSGAIGGTGGLTKTGSGSLTLSNTNNYSGTTTVSAGTLTVNGSTASATTVNSGGTLAGVGTLGGNVSVNSGGTLSLGNSAGTLTVNGNLQMNAGSTLAVEINGTTAGSQYDQVVVTGSVDVSGTTLSVSHGYASGNGDSYILIVNDAADGITGTFSGLPEGGTTTAAGNGTLLTASYIGGSGNDFTLTAPINDAPVVGNLNGDSVGVIEGGSPALLDSGSNATVTDSDSTYFDGGNVTVAIVANRASGEDILAIVNQGSGAGQIGVSGSNVTFGGVLIGTFTGGTGSNDLVISLNANATSAAVQALVRNITYSNSNTLDPSTVTRTVRVTVNDGDGATSGNADIAVSVTGVNDAPTLSATGGTPTYTENGSAVDLFSGVSIGTIEAGQAIIGLTLTVGNLANGASEILSIDGTDIALVNGANGVTGSNGIGYSVSVSGGTATVTLTHAGLSTASVQTVIDGMTYRNSSEAPTGSSRVVTLTSITDNGGTSNGGVNSTSVSIAATVGVDAVNDAPGTPVVPSLPVSGSEDVPLVLNGISFSDIDAGSGVVQATFSVAPGSGTFSALAGAGVTLTGSGTNQLVLSGSLSDINAFIASSQVSYLSAVNASGTVIVTVSLDDRGNTGTGGAKVSSATFNLAISPVNDAPVNSVPGAQTVLSNETLVFSAGNGNAISISDVDVAGGNLRVTLVGVNGLITLGSTSGLLFLAGDGTFDAIMTFDGSLANINNALAGLSFTPMAGYHGAASLQIITNDQGQSGSGGPQTDTDIISINVEQPNPSIVGVSSSTSDGSYKSGNTITITVDFSRAVDVDTISGVPTLILSSGGTATYSGGSGTSTLTFTYIVGAGQNSGDLDYASINALVLNGAVISDAFDGRNASLALAAPGSAGSLGANKDIVVDTIAPTTTGNAVIFSSDTGSSSVDLVTKTAAQTISGTLSTNLASGESVQVSLDNGFTWATASASPGSPNWSLAGQTLIGSNTLKVRVVDAAGNIGPAASFSYVLDTTVPTVAITSNAAALKAGESATLTFTFSEAPNGFTVSDLTATNGTLSNFTATSNPLVYTVDFTPNAGLTGSSGAVSLAAGLYTDTAGNAGGAGISTPIAIDTVAPVAFISSSASSLTAGETALITFTFSEVPQGFDVGDVIVSGGTLSGFAVTANPLVYTALFTPTANVNSGQATVSISAGSYTDAAGNAGKAAPTPNIQYDTAVPTTTVDGVQFSSDSGASASDLITNVSAQTISGTLSTNLLAGELVQVSLDNGATWVAAAVVGRDWTLSGQTLLGSGILQVRVADGAGNTGAVYAAAYTLDQSPPTVVISSDVATVNAVTSALITFTFSEAPVGFNAGAISVTEGTLGTLTATSDPKVFTATFTPNSGVANGSAVISVNTGSYTDAAGNAGTAGILSSLQIDTVAPTATPGGIQFSNDSGVQGDFITNVGTQTISGNLSVPLAQGDRVQISLDGGASWTTASASGTNWSASATLHPGSNTLQVKVSDAAGNEGAILSQAYVYDTTAPSVVHVDLPVDGAYGVGQRLDFTVHFSEAVMVDTHGGTPRIEVILDTGGIAHAEYLSSSGTSALVFRLIVASGQQDNNGITVGNSIQLNGGSLRDLAGNDDAIALTPGSSSGVLVDGVVPTVADVIVPANGGYKAGDVLSFTVNASEAVFTSGSPRLAVDIGGTTRYANFVASSSGGSTLVFQYTVQAGDNDADGISIASSLDLNGGSFKDAAGNDLNLHLNSVGSTAGVVVDTVAPSVTSIVRAGGSPSNSSSVSYTVTFSEDVGGVDISDFTASFGGTSTGSLASVTQVDGRTYTVVINNLSGAGDVTLSLNSSGTGIRDAVDNAVTGGLIGETYVIDRVAPAVTSVNVPANGSYVAEQNLDFTVNLSENVIVDTSGGTPRIAVVLDTGGTVYAQYLSGSGTSALMFRLVVASGQLDTNGITLGSSIQTGGAILRDSAGNDINTDLNSVASTSGVLVDAVVPTVSSVSVPAGAAYNAGDTLTFMVNISETVLVSGVPRLILDIGGSTVFANLVSGSGTSTLVFQYTVQAGDNDANGISVSASLDLSGGSVRDAAGNDLVLTLNGLGATSGVIVDTQRPTATIVVNDTALAVGESTTVIITFSEAVTGLDVGDFTVANGSLSNLSSSDGVTWTATLMPTASITDASNVITLNNTGYVDVAGNTGSGTTDSNNYAIDTQRPTATIVVNDTALAVGESTTVIITFSEAVTGLDVVDFTVANGSLSNLSSSDGITWTATLTPTASITDASNVITLNNTGYVDAAGNTGSGATDSNNYAIDTQRPTATIVVKDTALAVDESTTVIITFSEAVTGLDVGDFTVANGSLSNLSSSDGVTWTATLTPTASITDASNVITLNNTGYMDAAGNSGIGTAISNSYAIDTLDPVAPEITLDQATLVDGRQISPTGLVIISGLEAGGSWQYSLDNGASWLEGRSNAVQLPGLGTFSLWVQQRDAADNASAVTSLTGVVEPLVPPAVQPPGLPTMNDLPAVPGLASFQPSEVPEPNADFLHPASMMLGSVSRDTGMPRQDSWSEYGLPQSIAGVNDWMWASLFAPAESDRSGSDPAPEQFSVTTGVSTLDLKPVLLASESPWDIESLQFSFSGKQELPGWVRLDRHSGQLTINAPKDLSTTLVLQIKVSDGKGHESVRTVKLVVGDAQATSSVPTGRAGLSEKMANAANQQAGKRMSQYVHG
ncbi:Ig-like domain-containing protein [Comamonas thiooxydans]|uniref:Ig-like domain-containing protein n=1 Tax=Comamonas thiooxydans TaxID=363952 RepID=UPI00244AB361|nr:Ig-like domain-containing protein [Comamonas thiooxydans]MDH1252721.1 Ig-like domain-containing protein [Comamonas thiooxydans]